MPHKILKSLLPTEEEINSFQRLLNDHINNRKAHDQHMKMVAENPEEYHAYPHPDIGAHPDIIASLVPYGDDDYNIEFDIEDDITIPEVIETLEEKKRRLVNEVQMLSMEQSHSISPPRKSRLEQIEFVEISNTEKGKRTKKQQRQYDDYLANGQRRAAIQKRLAQAESDIDDLDEKAIDKWSHPSFKDL